MKKVFLLHALLFLFSFQAALSQDLPPWLDDVIYPLLDFHPYIGVAPVEENAMPFDPALDYKFVIDIYDSVKDSSAVHPGLTEVARTINLHIANGVPLEKLEVVAVIHGPAMWSILADRAYQDKYDISSPNLVALQELKQVGVDFYLCGQTMRLQNVPKENVHSAIEIALSAKTTLIMLDQKGYSYLNVNED